MEHVAILGASKHSFRYAYKAQIELTNNGHTVYPVSLKEKEILGVKTFQTLNEIKQKIDTVTVYISPQHLSAVIDDLLALKPRRVIFNPGSESSQEMNQLAAAGILVQEACTLVLLSIDQFEAD